jgi:DNA-binding response OmpR family regulator
MPEQTKTVLVAEDDNFLLNAYRVKLEHDGRRVLLARDGNETVEAFKNNDVDLIVLDLIMPVKDGFAALEEIRAMPKGKDVPIIIASNLGQKEDIEKGTRLGATDYIVKSNVSLLDELIPKINGIFDAQQQ